MQIYSIDVDNPHPNIKVGRGGTTYQNARIAIKETATSDCYLSKEIQNRGFQASSNLAHMSAVIVIVLPQPRAAVGGQLIPTGVQV